MKFSRKPTLSEKRIATASTNLAEQTTRLVDNEDISLSINEQLADLQELITSLSEATTTTTTEGSN